MIYFYNIIFPSINLIYLKLDGQFSITSDKEQSEHLYFAQQDIPRKMEKCETECLNTMHTLYTVLFVREASSFLLTHNMLRTFNEAVELKLFHQTNGNLKIENCVYKTCKLLFQSRLSSKIVIITLTRPLILDE